MAEFLHRLLAVLLLAVVAVAFLTTTSSCADELSPLEGLEFLRSRFAEMSNFTADITQEKQIALLRKTITSNGLVRFKRPDMFYMEVYPPYPSCLLLRDNVLTMLLPEEGVKQETVLPPAEGLSHWFGLIERPLTSLPEGIDVRAERHDGRITVWMNPKDKKGVKEIKLTLLEDGRPRELVIVEQNLDRTVIQFDHVRTNVDLTADDFHIK